ncbi:MAG: hypothetical protein ACI83O_000457 [Patescibacteria group bacterium]|jgi:hypothetical protein
MIITKRGDVKYDIIIYFTLGIIVLGLVIGLIFPELFSDRDVDYEVCRQSILLRANLPEVSDGSRTYASFKDGYPLQCKTNVLSIDYEDVSRAEKEIAETMATCWALYGEGKLDIFPKDIYTFETACVPCARVHMNAEVQDFYADKEIIIPRGLSSGFKGGTYLSYLNEGDGPFPAFNPAGARPFNLHGERFEVDSTDIASGILTNKLTGGTESGEFFWYSLIPSNYLNSLGFSLVNLPRNFNANNGDLLIFYAHAVSDSKDGIGNYFPYMFYTHSQNDYLTEMEDTFMNGPAGYNLELCNRFDGIAA